MRSQVEWHNQGDSSARRSSSSGARGSSESKKSTTRKSDESDRDCRKGDGEDNDIDASSPNRNQVVNVYDTPSDNRGWEDLLKEHQQIAFYAKKRKPDDSLLMNFQLNRRVMPWKLMRSYLQP